MSVIPKPVENPHTGINEIADLKAIQGKFM